MKKMSLIFLCVLVNTGFSFQLKQTTSVIRSEATQKELQQNPSCNSSLMPQLSEITKRLATLRANSREQHKRLVEALATMGQTIGSKKSSAKQQLKMFRNSVNMLKDCFQNWGIYDAINEELTELENSVNADLEEAKEPLEKAKQEYAKISNALDKAEKSYTKLFFLGSKACPTKEDIAKFNELFSQIDKELKAGEDAVESSKNAIDAVRKITDKIDAAIGIYLHDWVERFMADDILKACAGVKPDTDR